MKSSFYIMKLWKTGNVGSNDIRKADCNPKEGFSSYGEARKEMLKLYKEGEWELNYVVYTFTIMEIFIPTKNT